MDAAAYRRLLDTRHAVEVWLPDRPLIDWPGIDCLRVDRATGRQSPMTWLRGPSVLVLLASKPPAAAPTGSLGRVLRRRRQEVRS